VKLFGKPYTVVGVSADMINNSPYDSVEPAIFIGGSYTGEIVVKIKPGLNAHAALAGMEPVFKKYDPASPFLYKFVDNAYAAKFEAEQRIGNLAAVFTGLAIFISCLGLFGLAAFVAEQRTKEIGVRKVLGASVINLWQLLSKDFLKLTALSILIAVPLGYWLMSKWLENYKYQAPQSWWIFASAGAGIIVITLLTVSYQSIKAALMNPVKSLRSE
jgi:putative ABC transport system permease protein